MLIFSFEHTVQHLLPRCVSDLYRHPSSDYQGTKSLHGDNMWLFDETVLAIGLGTISRDDTAMKRSEETSCIFKGVANGQRSYIRKPFQRGANAKLLGISILAVARIRAHRTVPIESDIAFGGQKIYVCLVLSCFRHVRSRLLGSLRLAYVKEINGPDSDWRFITRSISNTGHSTRTPVFMEQSIS